MKYLYDREFVYSIPMDGNRYEDGIDLRYRFGDESDIPQPVIANVLDSKPCSVLEMMVALSLRIEEEIMRDFDSEKMTSKWFWGMLLNLGLCHMDDSRYDGRYVQSVVNRLLYRDYLPNGEGGLFTVRRRKEDLRTIDIWYQMCWYLNEV